MQYIAYITKGLEEIAQKEIEDKIPDAIIKRAETKIILFSTQRELNDVIQLKAIDDLGVLLTEFDNAYDLNSLKNIFNQLDLSSTIQFLQKLRDIDEKKLAITISMVGIKEYSSSQIREEASNSLTKIHLKTCSDDYRSNLDFRIFIDHNKGYISLRTTSQSLHHRPYKKTSTFGALRPTVAAAMVLLATQSRPNVKIVDNFCGSGTILCEALSQTSAIYGGDISPGAVQATRTNTAELKFKNHDQIRILDATKTPWPSHTFDCAISNLPWDKQIEVQSITDLYVQSLQEYKRILKSDGTLCFLLTKPDLFIKHAKKIFSSSVISTYKIGLLGQTPTIVLIKQ